MAKEMQYETGDGVTHNKSYWRPVAVHIFLDLKRAIIEFQGHTNKAARNAGKSPISNKSYIVDGDMFDNYFTANKLANKDPYAMSYKLAVEVLDTNSKSFFEGAIDV
jgi:hypothetical protein